MNDRNKALIISGVIMLLVALAAFLVGGWLAGWDFAAFFQSATFVWICVLVGLYILAVIGVFAYERIKRL